ncbi:ubiquitin conjugating enzyme [Striga asiatica]|uniref:Ubiquitin conjugating enzyme n=1 Tax=Striga asiatica TaxID=4170 RepID=A0A5A7QU32_STRAF|nr:ubiquitin conjugating enzyme [Striga asiatica]
MADSGKTENASSSSHFDVVPLAADHHFLHDPTKKNSLVSHFSNAQSPVYRAIMREWKILQSSLPDSIHVQTYETRIDLLRAVVIGPQGTPYHDGLFFFDISLPAHYPVGPPSVYYRSHGYRLNPNLYANGKVCLSLINTWYGNSRERWTHGSTLLQLLVSIQGLVLNERPFFNEPGFEAGKNSQSCFWVKSSNVYNETTFVLSCKTMARVARSPPKKFEEFVDRHFRARADPILTAIGDYVEGLAMVGSLEGDEGRRIRVSRRFKNDLARVRGELEVAFSRYLPLGWVDCNRAVDVEKPKEDVKKKGKKGLWKSLLGLWRRFGIETEGFE